MSESFSLVNSEIKSHEFSAGLLAVKCIGDNEIADLKLVPTRLSDFELDSTPPIDCDALLADSLSQDNSSDFGGQSKRSFEALEAFRIGFDLEQQMSRSTTEAQDFLTEGAENARDVFEPSAIDGVGQNEAASNVVWFFDFF